VRHPARPYPPRAWAPKQRQTSSLSAPPLLPYSLCSASRRPPLFQVPSTTTRSRWCLLMHLCVVLGWGSAHQADHRSETTGRSPSVPFPSSRPHTTMEGTVLVRFCPPAAPNWNTLGLGSIPDPFPTGRRPPVGQILSGIAGAEEGEKRSPVLRCRGPKGLMGLTAPVDGTQWQSKIFLFHSVYSFRYSN
jgi:hypothetical protein